MTRMDRQIMSLRRRLDQLETRRKEAKDRTRIRKQALARRIGSRRARVRAMRRNGMSMRAIASTMAVSPATVLNDLKA